MARPPHRPTLRAYEEEVARGIGAAPYGAMPPITDYELNQMVQSYDKAYGTHYYHGGILPPPPPPSTLEIASATRPRPAASALALAASRFHHR